MGTYTTIQGDMWDQIAYKALGSTAYTGELMAKNRDKLGYYTFPAGVVLELPTVKTGETDTKAPPWKRGVG
jgi:phage tail protein X